MDFLRLVINEHESSTIMKTLTKLLAFWCWYFFETTTHAFATGKPALIEAFLVRTGDDWNALADMRYNEWILPLKDDNTSREAFRFATRDIYEEERPRSTLLLAKRDGKVIGAAEMSPYEVESAQVKDTSQKNAEDTTAPALFSALYVTDVVTSHEFRRQGVARFLMETLEEHAIADGYSHLVLNVAEENSVAIQFYKSLDYNVPSVTLGKVLDTEQLNKNAGTEGQMVLVKEITSRQQQ